MANERRVMKLWEMIMQAVKDAEIKAAERHEAVKHIKINPRYMDRLQEETAELQGEKPLFHRMKENKGIIETFMGIPLYVDEQIEKWEVVIKG